MEKPLPLEYMMIRFGIMNRHSTQWWECRVIAPDGSVSNLWSGKDATQVKIVPWDPVKDLLAVELLNQYGADGWSLVSESDQGLRFVLSRPKPESGRF